MVGVGPHSLHVDCGVVDKFFGSFVVIIVGMGGSLSLSVLVSDDRTMGMKYRKKLGHEEAIQ